ncbi:MAG: rhodanese-like domain-containing protein [Deferrisomatales bacterium]|nr:rhodanese-like domain-containing protein [Deferrisomatales bacterium]
MARELQSLGFTKVYALKGGWREWETASYPMEQRK